MCVEAMNDLWAICLTTLRLSFPICKMEKMEIIIYLFIYFKELLSLKKFFLIN